MMRVPPVALGIGVAGLIPFVWGAATFLSPALAGWGAAALGPRFVGPYVQLAYGMVILAFMSGVIWGFAARGTGVVAASAYVLSVIPALWAFFMTGGGPTSAALNLIVGFVALLLIDWHCARNGLAPPWWMALRIGLTAVVVLSLLPMVL